MSTATALKLNTVKKMVEKLPRREQTALSNYLDRKLLGTQIRQFVAEASRFPISVDDINKAAEKARRSHR